MISKTTSTPRRITILGAGVLGRRIAAVFLAGGHDVHIRDPSGPALTAASEFITANISSFAAITSPTTTPGELSTFNEIPPAVSNSWLVIECVPETLPLKVSTFEEVDVHAPEDCIIASNSSSFKSRLMIERVSESRKERALNMHFTMPPAIRTVELMTDGETEESLFPLLSSVLRECGMVPVTARRESTGFIFNRLWAAIKREILSILSEDVSTPEEIDLIWKEMFHQTASSPPCRMMDNIGLDTVAFIEDNYVQERGLDGTHTVDWLRENYVDKGRLGTKSGPKGGLYPPSEKKEVVINGTEKQQKQVMYLLDVGLGENSSEDPTSAGRILRFDAESGTMASLVTGQRMPDGIDVSKKAGRIFWTNMGRSTRTFDGSVKSAKLDGMDIQTVVPEGEVYTPKQLVVDDIGGHLYFCDREGMSVHRVRFDGTGHEILVRTGKVDFPDDKQDMTRWCVGIALDASRGLIYWTQKGPSKGGQGRIFRAGMEIPVGENADNRSDIELLVDGLPEPIDLELDAENQLLYWTDRGEHPLGCTLNRVDVRGRVEGKKKTVLARHFHEPIGVKLAQNGDVYVADLGGSVYRVRDGAKTEVWRDGGCYTGVSLV